MDACLFIIIRIPVALACMFCLVFFHLTLHYIGRHVKDDLYRPTTWQIVFYLPVVEVDATYKFRLVLAGANLAELQVTENQVSNLISSRSRYNYFKNFYVVFERFGSTTEMRDSHFYRQS